jgi:hypothetical protein
MLGQLIVIVSLGTSIPYTSHQVVHKVNLISTGIENTACAVEMIKMMPNTQTPACCYSEL